MLLAEVHGHASRELADNEDYLTSAIFGHLRYLSPSLFWTALFSRALGTLSNGQEQSLLEFLQTKHIEVAEFATVDAYFWPSHEVFGTPDLILCFSAEKRAPLVLVCEAKLWAGKSGANEQDQLLRYLRLLSSLGMVKPRLRASMLANATAVLLYITPRDSLAEVHETAALCSTEQHLIELLFRVQWQDVTEAAEESRRTADRLSGLLLSDVSSFLRSRGLEYFRGFSQARTPAGPFPEAAFYGSRGDFTGFEFYKPDVDPGSFGLFYNPTTGWPDVASQKSCVELAANEPELHRSRATDEAHFTGFHSFDVQLASELSPSFYTKR